MSRWITIGLAIVAIAVLPFLCLPAILSTSWGTQRLVEVINARIQGKIEIERLYLSWFNHQLVEKVHLKDPEKNESIFSFDLLTTNQSLWRILWSGFGFAQSKLVNLNASITLESNGRTHLERMLSSDQGLKVTPISTILLKNFTGGLNVPSMAGGAVVGFELSGETKHEDLTGHVEVKGKWVGNFPLFNHPGAGDVHIDINHFPVEILDRLFALRSPLAIGLIKELLGASLNLVADGNYTIESDAPVKAFAKFDLISPHLKLNGEANTLPENQTIDLTLNGEIVNATHLLSAIGNEATFNFQATLQQYQGIANFKFTSDNIQSENMDFSWNDHQFRMNPLKINYRLSPALVNDLFSPLVKLEEEAHLRVDVNVLEFPLPLRDKKALSLDVRLLALGEMKLSAGMEGGSFSIENAAFELSGSSLEKMSCHLSAGLTSQKSGGFVWNILGKNTQINAGAILSLREPRQVDLSGIKVLAEGQLLQLDVHADYVDGKFNLSSPASMKYVLNPEQFPEALFPSEIRFSQIPASLFFTIAPPSQAWDPQKLETLTLSGDLSSSPIHVNVRGLDVVINDLLIPWEVDGNEDKIKLNFSGTTLIPSTENYGTFKGRYSLKEWTSSHRTDFANALHRFEASLVEFPVEPLSLFGAQQPLIDLIGSRFNANVDVNYRNGDQSGVFDLVLDGEALHLDAGLSFSEVLALKEASRPAKLSMQITPERFLALQKILRKNRAVNYTLASPAQFDLSIEHLKLPWLRKDGSATFPYWHSGIKAQLYVDKMVLNDLKHAEKLPFNQTTGSIDSLDISKMVSFHVRAEPDQEVGFHGKMDLNGVAENLLTSNGSFNLESLSLDLKVKALDFETFAFCHIFCPFPRMAEKVEALLGSPLNADIDTKIINMNGPVQANLVGTNGKAFLEGNVLNGVFTLKKPFSAEVQASPKLGKDVLGEIAPFFYALESSNQPITFLVDTANFRFPMKQFDLKNIEVGLCAISTGKMLFRNEGEINTVLGLLGNNSSDLIPAWVTPLYVHMKDGKITLERVDLLLSNLYPIAVWGAADLDKNKVGMVIGISGAALKNALGVKNVDPHYMLQIPLKGTLGHVKIDKKKAAARISSLALQGQGTKGAILGTILDIAGGGLGDAEVPPPTTTPLPWE